MSDKKRTRKRKDEYTGPGGVEQEVEKPAKEEYSVAKWIRSHVPTKKTKFLNHNVEYFTATKALDALMLSKHAQGDGCLFPSREIAIEFLDAMLVHKFFHRAKKVPVSEMELKGGKGKIKNEKEKDKKDLGTQTAGNVSTTNKDKVKEDRCTDAESSHVEGKMDKGAEKEKRKRKIRLDMHPDQVFIDGPEAYVWIYDPIPMHYWLFGALLVVGAIVICLFPLWPPSLRKGVYYLSIAAAGFLLFILALAVLRFIVFCIVWLVTGSKHHFWLFPNLTEDVGFFASFWPLYKHEYKDPTNSKTKFKKRKKDKDSDNEDDDISPLDKDIIENIKEHDAIEDNLTNNGNNEVELLKNSSITKRSQKINETDNINTDKKGKILDESSNRKNSLTPSESESESSQRSSTGKDFEMVDPADVDTS